MTGRGPGDERDPGFHPVEDPHKTRKILRLPGDDEGVVGRLANHESRIGKTSGGDLTPQAFQSNRMDRATVPRHGGEVVRPKALITCENLEEGQAAYGFVARLTGWQSPVAFSDRRGLA